MAYSLNLFEIHKACNLFKNNIVLYGIMEDF